MPGGGDAARAGRRVSRSPKPMSMWMSAWLAVLLAACGGEAGPTYVPEAVLDCALPPDARWREPGEGGEVTVITNALGLRGSQVVVPRPAGVFRIVALGDEVTFGSGVPDEARWTSALARALTAADGRRVEVVAAGVPGWCVAQQFLFLRREVFALEPDLVLWQLAGDDLRELALMESAWDTRALPIGRLPRPVQDERLRAALIEELHALGRDDFGAQLAVFHLGRSTPVLERSLAAVRTRRRAAAPASAAATPPTDGPAGAPIGPLEELGSAAIVARLAGEPAFAVAVLDHLVSTAGNLARAQGAGLRLVLADDGADAGRPDRDVAALRAWAARRDPTVLDTRTVLLGQRPFLEASAGGGDGTLDDDQLVWNAQAHAAVGAAAALWLASDGGSGLVRRPPGR